MLKKSWIIGGLFGLVLITVALTGLYLFLNQSSPPLVCPSSSSISSAPVSPVKLSDAAQSFAIPLSPSLSQQIALHFCAPSNAAVQLFTDNRDGIEGFTLKPPDYFARQYNLKALLSKPLVNSPEKSYTGLYEYNTQQVMIKIQPRENFPASATALGLTPDQLAPLVQHINNPAHLWHSRCSYRLSDQL